MQIYSNNAKFKELFQDILSISNKRVPKIDFLQEISKKMLEFTNADSVEFLMNDNDTFIYSRKTSIEDYSFQYEVIPAIKNSDGVFLPELKSDLPNFNLHLKVFTKNNNQEVNGITPSGSLVGQMSKDTSIIKTDSEIENNSVTSEKASMKFVVIPVNFGNSNIGTMLLTSSYPNFLQDTDIELLEKAAQNIGIAMVNQRTQSALKERVKELSCIYRITQVAENEDASLESILRSIAELIPTAWQYPEITSAKITYKQNSYISINYRPGWQKQVSDIIVWGLKKGVVEVSYSELRPVLDEGPFSREERNLIDAISRQVSLVIERREAQKERIELQDQLRHADRLAMIGQLAAGVAHELNEPLGNILGFAQLIQKRKDFEEQTEKDIDKIIKASLHAREIIRKLLLFAREIKTSFHPVDINKVIESGLYFLESRCLRMGIEVIKKLDKNIPNVMGDESQLHQALVNLVVNAIQAMPDGGRLLLQTHRENDNIIINVEDNGIGMTDDLKSKIFIPFFTTKDINEGTGLGLAVVHGIIMSHKGQIRVESELGRGSKFELKIPVT